MHTLFAFLFIISISCALGICFRHRIEETIPVSILGIILVLYIFGLACGGSLLPGVYVCLAFGGISLLYVGKSIVTDRDRVKENCLVPGLLVYFILFAWLWYINRDRLFSSWDEFSHWGLVVKNMDFFDWFGNHPESTVNFRGYPPATALWQYFIGKLYGAFSEGHVYQATGWLIAALCMPIASKMKWKNTFGALFSACFLIAVPMIFNASYLILLYVDVILGIMLGYLLYCGFFGEKKDVFYYVNISVTLCALALTKASGVFLALVATAVIGGYELVKAAKGRQKRDIKRVLIMLAGFLAAILIGKFSWSIYLKLTETSEAWNTSSMTLSNIFNLFIGKGEGYQYTTITNFLNALGETAFNSYIFNMRYVSWVVLAMALFYVLSIWVKEKSRFQFYAWGSMIGLAIYTIGLMFLYVFTFSEYGAVNLASFQRYLSTYFVALVYFISGVLFTEINGRDVQTVRKVTVAAVGVSLLFVPVKAIWDATVLYKNTVNATIAQRANYIGIEPYLNEMDWNYTEDRIWYISQNTTGFEYWNLRYLATPVKPAESGYWSLGEPYYDGDLWTIDIPPEEWLESLETQNAYVYLYKIDEIFIEKYKDAFESEEDIIQGGMYKLDIRDARRYLKRVVLENN